MPSTLPYISAVSGRMWHLLAFYLNYIINKRNPWKEFFNKSEMFRGFLNLQYPLGKICSDKLKWWLGTEGIKAGTSRLKKNYVHVLQMIESCNYFLFKSNQSFKIYIPTFREYTLFCFCIYLSNSVYCQSRHLHVCMPVNTIRWEKL